MTDNLKSGVALPSSPAQKNIEPRCDKCYFLGTPCMGSGGCGCNCHRKDQATLPPGLGPTRLWAKFCEETDLGAFQVRRSAESVPFTPSPTRDWADIWAQDFHDTYERAAPKFGYETRPESAKPWAEVPEKNRKLMTAVCAEVLCRFLKSRESGVPSTPVETSDPTDGCKSPYHRPTSLYCLDCIPSDAPLGVLLLSNRHATASEIERGLEIARKLEKRRIQKATPVETASQDGNE